jgi:hypothetical protein
MICCLAQFPVPKVCLLKNYTSMSFFQCHLSFCTIWYSSLYVSAPATPGLRRLEANM